MEPSPCLLSRTGPGWAVRYDLCHLPHYVILQLEGESTMARSQVIAALLEEHRARTLLPDGRFVPFITDLRAEGRPTIGGLRGASAIYRELAPAASYSVILLDPQRPLSRMLRPLIMAVQTSFPAFPLHFAYSEANAIALVSQHQATILP